MSPLLTPGQLASQLNVPQKSIYHWVRHNSIPHLRVGRHLRFSLERVLAELDKRTAEKSQPCRVPLAHGKSVFERSLKTRN